MASPAFLKRIQKELRDFTQSPPQGLILKSEASLERWEIQLTGAEGTLYAGEVFTLQVTFSPRYPFESPEVVFVGTNIPVHPHIYSNGHICLNILYQQWSPALSVQSVCLSIMSMLSSCQQKVPPADNDRYVRRAVKSPKDTLVSLKKENGEKTTYSEGRETIQGGSKLARLFQSWPALFQGWSALFQGWPALFQSWPALFPTVGVP